MLRALTAQDEAEKKQDGIPQDQLITLLTLTLAMLAALNPIQPPRRHAKPTQQPASIQAEPSSMATLLSKEQNPPNADARLSGSQTGAEPQMQEAELSPTGSQPQQAAALHGTQKHQAAPHIVADPDSQHDSLQAQSQADADNQLLFKAVSQLLSQQDAESPEQLIRLAQQFLRQSPYKGYRCDLVAFLANLCFRRLAVQNKVQQLGGTELILSQCQVRPCHLCILQWNYHTRLFLVMWASCD